MSTQFPLPDTEWEVTREFWRAAERGELVIPRCTDCDTYNWYPRESCKRCGGATMPWTRVSGRGTLFAWAVVRRGLVKGFEEKAPYVSALVSLEEDPAVRLVTTLVECTPEELRVEMPVRVVFRKLEFKNVSGSVIAPLFEPAV